MTEIACARACTRRVHARVSILLAGLYRTRVTTVQVCSVQ